MSRRDELPCPIEGCPRTRGRYHAMCPTHWAQVPADVKREVNDAWRARLTARGDRDARMRHLQALEDAEAVVEGRTPISLWEG